MKFSEIKSKMLADGIECLIVRGVSGSGKSTLAKAVMAEDAAFKQFEADMYFIKDGEYRFDGTRLGAAHGWCQNNVEKVLSGGGKVIVSNTFTTHREVKPYVELCKDLGKKYMIVKCVGKFKNVHNVPEEALNRMRDRWQDMAGEIEYSI
jgi:predicted kinase